MSDMRTPLGRVRGLGSAKDGTEHFWHQRVTAIALVFLALAFVGFLLALVGASHAQATAYVGSPIVAVVLVLFLVAGFYHLKLGIQVVVEDYVHSEAAKVGTLLFNTFACAVLGLVCIFSVLKIAFGG